jgi:Ni,Fe-hydrogenase III small subunit/ferredoxin-like protein FixX
MIKRLQNKKNNNNTDSGNGLPQAKLRDTDNILNNSIETIKDPLKDLQVIPSEYRGKITFIKRSIDEREKEILQNVCPTEAFSKGKKSVVQIDHGKCIMCGRCKDIIPNFIKIDNLFSHPVYNRTNLNEFSCDNDDIIDGRQDVNVIIEKNNNSSNHTKHFEETGRELQNRIQSIFGRSLSIRTVNAGSCNGCEIEINALLNPIYDIERYGIHFVSSPRHADILLVTGPISSNMEESLKLTYDAIPNPKAVIAAGACGCSGGIFADSYSVIGGIDKVVPVDVYIAGCPPRPQALLEGIFFATNKLASMIQG